MDYKTIVLAGASMLYTTISMNAPELAGAIQNTSSEAGSGQTFIRILAAIGLYHVARWYFKSEDETKSVPSALEVKAQRAPVMSQNVPLPSVPLKSTIEPSFDSNGDLLVDIVDEWRCKDVY